MEYGITAKAFARTVDLAFITAQRAAPHVIAANKTVAEKVMIPVGLFALAGATTVVAKIVDPKSRTRR